MRAAALSFAAILWLLPGWAADQTRPDLASAIRSGDLRQLRMLLDAGAKPDKRDSLGATALHDAVWAGRADMVELLLERGANANAPHAEGGSTPLDYAVLRDDLTVANLLLKFGADANAEYPSGVTPLQLAAPRGNIPMMQLLVGAGAKVRHRDKAGSAAMDEAAARGAIRAVEFLAANGAEIDAPNPYTGETPLNEAASRGDAEVAAFLLKHRANPGRRDLSGSTPLENAARFRRAAAVRVLLEMDGGATGRESALLDDAVLRGDMETVRMLASGGADVNARGNSGAGPLDDAALKGNAAIARILLEHGANVEARNAYGATPLHDAALSGQVEVAKLLLDWGADVNARESESGSTPLYSAAAMGHAAMAELLLARGADPRIPNRDGRSAARAAKSNGFPGIAASLSEHGIARAATFKARLDTQPTR
jgi:ankyrin repeat protein